MTTKTKLKKVLFGRDNNPNRLYATGLGFGILTTAIIMGNGLPDNIGPEYFQALGIILIVSAWVSHYASLKK